MTTFRNLNCGGAQVYDHSTENHNRLSYACPIHLIQPVVLLWSNSIRDRHKDSDKIITILRCFNVFINVSGASIMFCFSLP